MKSPKTDRLSAAADLIRNLDNALLGMNTAANSAADDAAKARRNAKAAGEVARRYRGGSSTKSGSNRKKRTSVDNTNSILEKKRERRAAARMAAEARERREHPYTHSSPSRVHGLSSPSRRFDNTMDDAEVNKGILDETVEAIQLRATELEESKKKEKILVEDDNNVKMDGSPSSQNAEAMVEDEENNVQERYSSLSNATGSTVFEDAMDEQEDDVVENDGQESIEKDEQQHNEGIGAPPTNNEYYNQQTSYYSSPDKDQRRTNIDRGAVAGDDDEEEADQTSIEYSDFSKNQDQYYKEKLDASTPNKKNKIMPISTISTPKHKHSIPPTPPRSQPTSTTRIEASHAEDVLSLSLELEKVRSQLTSTTAQLATATSQVSNLQDINDDLTSQLSAASVQHNQIAILQQQLDTEQRKSKAAEEDAALALDLAKDANSCKEECEMWLSRSLEEIDLWKGRFLELEKHQKEQLCQEKDEEEDQNKKSVRFDIKDDCPPSPMVSVEDGTFGLEEDVDTTVIKATPQPPPPPPPTPAEHLDTLSPIHAKGLMFSPPANNSSTTETPLSKEAAILAGRAYLYRASQSPSPYSKGSLSPHPRLQASDLLKKSAETRRLLRERLLTPGRHGPKLSKPPMSVINANRNVVDSTDGTFASRQGAACQAVGKTIRESGARLKLSGKWWGNMLQPDDATTVSNGEEGTIEELELMVKDYCGGVEGEIVQQRTKIDELLAFCDHLEKEMIV